MKVSVTTPTACEEEEINVQNFAFDELNVADLSKSLINFIATR